MRSIIGCVALLMLTATPVLADTPTSVDSAQSAIADLRSRPIPKSVWQIDDKGNARHLQSTLHCDADVNGYKRINIITYDKFGLDVSCEYKDDNGDLITIYLTRRSGRTLSDDFTEAKRELTTVTPEATPMADEAQKVFSPDVQWLHLLYSERVGAIDSGIWISDLDGWTLEFRATYAPDRVQSVFDEMSALTVGAQSTAGTHLDLCARALPVQRTAQRVTDKDKLMLLTLVSSTSAAVVDSSTRASDEVWCVEQTIDDPQLPMIFWRNISNTDQAGPVDRLTLMTVGEAPSLEIVSEGGMASILGASDTANGSICHAVTMEEPDRVLFYAYFEGRPDAASLLGVARDVFTSKAGFLSGYDRTKKTIIVAMPDAK